MTSTRKESAGLLLYRRSTNEKLEVLLGHPGGPFWAAKDEGAWSIPKGELEPGEDPLVAARREAREETGATPEGPFASLGSVRQKSGKTVHAWATPCDIDAATLAAHPCNQVEIEWPPRSGRMMMIPELDRVEYFPVEVARTKLNPAQAELLDRLAQLLASHE